MTTDEKLDLVLEKISTMDEKISTMDEKISTMDEKINTMDGKITALQDDVTGIKLQIENEILPDIRRVAEGHLDLDRKLKEVIKTNTDYEMLVLRVNHLETKVDLIERKIS